MYSNCVVYCNFVETASLRDAEKYYVHTINTMENDVVTNALCLCKILNQKNCRDLEQDLIMYQMSCLIVQIILHVNQADFEKICDHIKNQEQLKPLKDLYFGKLPNYGKTSHESPCPVRFSF